MPTTQPNVRLTSTQWLICVIAVIGFAFDIYEILMLPLIVRPALLELTGAAPGSPEYQMWVGRLFYVPAFAGGLFGLLGGYLTDRLGRRRVLTYSILIYAVAAFLSGFSTSIGMLLVLRCFVFIGVCVEFVAAIAWLAELFPEPKRREKVLGYTQAFSSVGGLLVAFANGLAVAYAASLPSIGGFGIEGITDPHAPWRYTLMSGVIPAIPLILIRPFLPESPIWQQKKNAGTLKRPSIAALFAPELRKTTIVTTVMFAMSVRRGLRRDSADSADRARTARGPRDGAGSEASAGEIDRTGRCIECHQGPGSRRPGWPRDHGLARRHHHQQTAPNQDVPGAGVDRDAGCVRGDCDLEPELALRGDFRRRIVYRRSIEFLGELPAPRVSGPPPRDG